MKIIQSNFGTIKVIDPVVPDSRTTAQGTYGKYAAQIASGGRVKYQGAGLVDHGPRISLGKGGSAQILEYLESLDLAEGVTADIDDVMQYAKENNIKIDQGSLARNLNNPDRLQTSGRYKGNYQLSDDLRARWNAVKNKVDVRKQIYNKKTQAKIFNQLDEIIPDKKTYPTRRSLMTKLGFSEESGSASINKMLDDYAEARNIDLTGRFPVGQYKGTQIAANIISDYKTGKFTMADLTRKYFPEKVGNQFNDAKKQVTYILKDAGVRDPSKFRNWPGDKPEQWKKVRAKRKRDLIKRVGEKTAAQTLALEDQIIAKNADILKMTDDEIWNNKKIQNAMNLDVKDLKKNGTLKFDRYTEFLADGKTKNPRYLPKKEFVAKVRHLADTWQFWQPDHMAGIATEKLHAMFPNQVQAASGKIGGQLDAMRAYLEANPNGKAVPEIEKLLNEFNMQIKSGGKTYGVHKNMYHSATGTSDIVEAGLKTFDKPSLAKKALTAAKYVGRTATKVLPVLAPAAVGLGLYDMERARAEGMDSPLELGTAYYLGPEVARGYGDIKERHEYWQDPPEDRIKPNIYRGIAGLKWPRS